jgi:hypothetical protein
MCLISSFFRSGGAMTSDVSKNSIGTYYYKERVCFHLFHKVR